MDVIRVVLVDDQELVRTGFRLVLGGQPDIEVVGEAGDGAAALEVVAQTRPDVVVMDVRMPQMDGVTATRRIRADAADGAPRVLILTTFDVDEYVYDAIRAGASVNSTRGPFGSFFSRKRSKRYWPSSQPSIAGPGPPAARR